MIIRTATREDVPEIARVHVQSAAAAYGALITARPDDEIARRVGNWGDTLDDPACSAFVAETDGLIVGVLGVGPARDGVDAGELRVLYVHPDWWGSGAGQQLVERAHVELAISFRAAVLNVLASNGRARRFYERNGWRFDAVITEPHFGGRPTEVARYVRDFEQTA